MENQKPCKTGHAPGFKITSKSDKIRIRMLVGMGALVAALLVISVAGIYCIQHNHIDAGVLSRMSVAQGLFDNLLDYEARFINGRIDSLKADPLLQKAWLQKDREALLARSQPLFETMHSSHGITHFYFVEPDKTCFLRVQDPDRYGDKKRLFTLDRVVAEGKAQYGIELGKLGTFTLRVIHPWRIDDTVVGYMELGMEIEHLTPRLKESLAAEILVIIDKDYLTRAKWEAGLRMMGRTGDWDRFANFIPIDSTMPKLPDRLKVCLENDGEQCSGSLFTAMCDGRKYRGGCVVLADAGNRQVGIIVILADITEAAASLLALSACLIGVAIVPGGGLLILCYFHTGRIARLPADDPGKPYEEIRQPSAIEEGAGLNGEMEEQIEIRTAELARTNELLQAEVADHMRAEEKVNETMDQLKRFNDLAVGRELRMVELKAEVNELCCQLDLQQRYLKPGRNESCSEPGTDRQSCTESAVESEA